MIRGCVLQAGGCGISPLIQGVMQIDEDDCDDCAARIDQLEEVQDEVRLLPPEDDVLVLKNRKNEPCS